MFFKKKKQVPKFAVYCRVGTYEQLQCTGLKVVTELSRFSRNMPLDLQLFDRVYANNEIIMSADIDDILDSSINRLPPLSIVRNESSVFE